MNTFGMIGVKLRQTQIPQTNPYPTTMKPETYVSPTIEILEIVIEAGIAQTGRAPLWHDNGLPTPI